MALGGIGSVMQSTHAQFQQNILTATGVSQQEKQMLAQNSQGVIEKTSKQVADVYEQKVGMNIDVRV